MLQLTLMPWPSRWLTVKARVKGRRIWNAIEHLFNSWSYSSCIREKANFNFFSAPMSARTSHALMVSYLCHSFFSLNQVEAAGVAADVLQRRDQGVSVATHPKFEPKQQIQRIEKLWQTSSLIEWHMVASELSKRYPKAPPLGYSTRGTTGEIILNFNRYVFQ